VDDILVLDNHEGGAHFPAEVHALLHEVVDHHFWYRARERIIVSTLQKEIGGFQGQRLLDVGCGTGRVLAALEEAGMNVCGLEVQLEGLRYARKRTNAPLVCLDAAQMPFVEQFDVVSLCDVLEHIEDELALLRSCKKAMRAGGRILVTVPASMKLWSRFDELDGHKRRYTKPHLRSVIERAGFGIISIEYFNVLLFPFQYAYRKGGNLLGRAKVAGMDDREVFLRSHDLPPRWLNALFSGLLWAERTLFPWIAWPFGTSLVAVAISEGRQ
jgi:SAM-dependent methyltransferase